MSNRNEEKATRRARYMDSDFSGDNWRAIMSTEHKRFYLWLAREIGVQAADLPVSVKEIRECLKHDRHLNNIPLFKWDRKHSSVAYRAAHAGFTGWSLSDTTCVLKSFAEHLASLPDYDGSAMTYDEHHARVWASVDAFIDGPDPKIYACPDGAACKEPQCIAENTRRAEGK